MKLTKSKLKQIIREELQAVEEDYRDADDKTMADNVPHSWLNHAALSSALQERYGIAKKDAVGKVLWHSWNEGGEVGVYDMKFGNTIIRNLLSEDIEATVQEGHGHPPKRDDDEERSKKK